MSELKTKIRSQRTNENLQKKPSKKSKHNTNENEALLQNKSEYCEYCNQKCHLQNLKFFGNAMKFITISPNVSYYFKFLEFIIFILLFDFLFYGIITHLVVLKNLTTFHCFLNRCLKEPNFEEAYKSVRHKILFTVNLAILILLKYLWLIYIRNINRKLDENEITPSDYTIYLKGIDVNKGSQQICDELTEYFKKWDAEVVRINLIYDIDPILRAIKKYTLAKQQKIKIQDKLNKQKEKKKINNKKLIKFNKQLEKAQIKLDKKEFDLRDFLGSNLKSKTQFLGKAYVTFQTQEQQRKVVKAHRFMVFQYRINIGKYKIARAYEPHDILWENLGQKTKTRYFIRIAAIAIGLLIFCCSFCIALSFRILQKGVKLNDPYAQYMFAFLVVLSLGTFLKIFQKVLEKLTTKERHRTITHFKISLGLKSVFSFFVNICCVLLSVNLIVHGLSDKFLYGTKGVVSSTQLILNFIVFGDFLLQLMDLLLIQRQYHQKRHLERIKKGRYLQECEKNKIRQVMQFNYTAHYNSIFKLLIIVFFYQSILVYPILMALFYMISTYIFEKIKYTKYCQKPPDLNFEFEMKMLKNLEFTFLVMALGYFAFVRIVTGKFGIYSIILICITALDYFILDPKLIHKLISSKEKLSDLRYEDVYLSFAMDYNRQNPLTQQKAFKEWFEQMQLKNKVIEVDEEVKEFVTDHKIQIEQIQKPEKKIDNDVLENLFNYILDKQNKTGQIEKQIDYKKFNLDSLLNENNDEEEGEQEKINYYKLGNETELRKRLFLQQLREKKKRLNIKLKIKQRPRKFTLPKPSTQIQSANSVNFERINFLKQFTIGRFNQDQIKYPYDIKPETTIDQYQRFLKEEKEFNFQKTKKFNKFHTLQEKKQKEKSIQSSQEISSQSSISHFSMSSYQEKESQNKKQIRDKRSLIDSGDLYEIEEENSYISESYESCEPQSLPSTQSTKNFEKKDFNN